MNNTIKISMDLYHELIRRSVMIEVCAECLKNSLFLSDGIKAAVIKLADGQPDNDTSEEDEEF